MEHFAPHPLSRFEGYYSKFDLPSGGHVALIICSVPKAKKRPHMISFTYTPTSSKTFFQREIWADEINMTKLAGGSFKLDAIGYGHMTVSADSSSTSYSITHPDFTFTAQTKSHQPWSSASSTPEGWLVHLPLPLHWHVHSVASQCSFNLSIPPFPDFAAADHSGTAAVHQEKNWANSFPAAHMWIQARKGLPADTTAQIAPGARGAEPFQSICIAGGQIIGTEAYLIGYRSSTHPAAKLSPSKVFELDFRPPFALRLLGKSPTMSLKSNFDKRTFALSVRDWWYRIDVRAEAPADTFFPLSSPFPEGHRENYLAESFEAEISVRVYKWVWGSRWWDVRSWWAPQERNGVGCWIKEEELVFANGSLEFGGGYYGFAGSETCKGRPAGD